MKTSQEKNSGGGRIDSDGQAPPSPLLSQENDRIIEVLRPDGEVKRSRIVEGHVFVCKGCCCGNIDRDFPAVPIEAFKSQWKSRGIRRQVHLTITGCLGPCNLANVVLIYFRGEPIWFQAINSEAQVSLLYDHIEQMLTAGRFLPLPHELARLRFDRYLQP
ncbi:MAG: (2Fe-2S) ferredoxin domain-containing protein [Acidobacteriota bacterium]